MPSNIEERLLEEFSGLFDYREGALSVRAVEQAVAATPAGNGTPAAAGADHDSGGRNVSAGSIATTFLESGFGVVPLITGLIGLFSGGSDSQPSLEKYQMPSTISFLSADTAGGLAAADYDQFGAPRPYAPTEQSAAPQITVNVQAMDAQSFMDYSGQIAQAVRGAMLNLSSLNDVVNEL